jgi:chitinase
LNGVDIDWEVPSNEVQAQQYSNLLARLRVAMPAPQYLVTTAVPASIWALETLNLGEASQHVDLINLMAYDFVGPFPGITKSGHHAQLRCPAPTEQCNDAAQPSSEAAVRYLLEHGVPRHKILLGIPLYGRSFLGAHRADQPFHAHGGTQPDGIFEFKDLPITTTTTTHPKPRRNDGEHTDNDGNLQASQTPDPDAITPCVEQFDPARAAAWCVGPQTPEGGGFITYDNAMAVEAKGRWVREEGLAGLFYWHICFDKPKGEGSLVDVGARALGSCQNWSSWWPACCR